MFSVYVIYNKTVKKTYTGQTVDINKRLTEHNNHTFKGFTSRYRGEWVLIYKESVATRSEALKREKQLKSGNGRVYIQQYIPG
jgi:putative endonuclease